MPGMLTEADVKRLMSDPSGEARADTAGKVAVAFQAGALTQSERGLAEQIFRVMVKDAEVKVRSALSRHLMSASDLPHDLALSLARDVEEVSLPFLETSSVLNDADLIEIVRTAGVSKQNAVARRANVSGELASAIIDHGKSGDVMATLAANAGADLSDANISRMLDKHGDNVALTNSLVTRRNLPLGVSERLVALVSQRFRDFLVEKRDMSEEMATDMVLQARERATISLLPPGVESGDVIDFVEQLKKTGRLSPSLILRALCTGDLAFFEAALSVLSGVPIVNARVLIHDSGELGLRTVYQRAGLPFEQIHIFRAAFEAVRELEYDGGERDRQRYTAKVIERVLTKVEQKLDQSNLDYLMKKLQQLAA
jgi:uncharacterized protein (DUF2336 family)